MCGDIRINIYTSNKVFIKFIEQLRKYVLHTYYALTTSQNTLRDKYK